MDSPGIADAWPQGRLMNRTATWLCCVLLAGCAAAAVAMSAYSDDLRATRLGVTIGMLLGLHLLWRRKFFWCREFTIYAGLFAYMLLALAWTHDTELALNTLVPAANVILIAVLFGSMIRFYDRVLVLGAAVSGFACAAAYYTLTRGFPFSYPVEFSYNAIAAMYLSGLFLTLMLSCFSRSVLPFLALAAIFVVHIVATTSIKTNLGIALGLVCAAMMYSRHFGRLLRRRLPVLILALAVVPYVIATNEGILDTMQRGVHRVMIGIEVLQARDDQPGYTSYEERANWRELGIEGWKQNPLFGHGTEAFREANGITSHSTPIDLMYNFGLIGLLLFYSLFASLGLRLLSLDGPRASNWRSLIVGGLVCYAFISLSGTVHYNAFLAVFIGVSAALLNDSAVATQRGVHAARSTG
jgi:hypothetical protein